MLPNQGSAAVYVFPGMAFMYLWDCAQGRRFYSIGAFGVGLLIIHFPQQQIHPKHPYAINPVPNRFRRPRDPFGQL